MKIAMRRSLAFVLCFIMVMMSVATAFAADNGNINYFEVDSESILNGKSITFFGDSICYASCELNTEYSEIRGWPGRIGVHNGMTYYNMGRSGASVSSCRGTNTIINQINNAINTLPECDIYILHGGTNDAWDSASEGSYNINDFSGDYDEATFAGGLEEEIYTIKNKYPNAIFGYIINFKFTNTGFGGKLMAMDGYVDMTKKICDKWGIPYLDLYSNTELLAKLQPETRTYLSDGVHPTTAGYEVITPYIEAWIKELVLTNTSYTTYYLPACPSTSTTMYATMNSMGIAGNYDNLKKIALANGYTESTYVGSAEQNTALLDLWKKGLLKNPDAVCDPAYPIASATASSLADAVGSFGFDNSANTVKRIKIANKTTNETELLNLMKKGTLLQPIGSATAVEFEDNSDIIKTNNFSDFAFNGVSGDKVLYSGFGGTISISFTGTKLDIITTIGPRLKSMHISVDGGVYQRVEPGSTSVKKLERVYSTGLLSNGNHTLRIRCEGQIHLDVMEVFNGTVVKGSASLEDSKIIEGTDNSKIQYSSRWKKVENLAFDNGEAMYVAGNGTAAFTFYGSQFVINSAAVYEQKSMLITVDGGEAVSVSLSNAKDGERYTAYDSGILSAGNHTVTVTAEDGAVIDSVKIFGSARNSFICQECGGFLDDKSFTCNQDTKNKSDMLSTYQDESEDFSVVDTSTLTGGTAGVDATTAYLYSPTSQTARKNGFALYQPIKGDFYGNETNWTIDAWVYMSNIPSSYCMIMQFIPQSGFSMYSLKDSTKFNNYTENWAYRLILTNTSTGAGKVELTQGWNHIQVPLSDVTLGSAGNDHTKAAYTHLKDMGGVIDAVTFHENSDASYGTYDFAVASIKLVRGGHEHIEVEEPQPEYNQQTYEVENILSYSKVSNAWIKRYVRKLSGKYTLHTTKGGKFKFAFEGDSFDIISYRSPSQGRMYISIDGADEIEVDLTADVYDTYFMDKVFESGTLTNGKHYVDIRVEGTAVLDALNINGDIVNCDAPVYDDVTIEVENILDAVYTGNWTKKQSSFLSAGEAMYNTDGGSVSFEFEGKGFSLVSYKANTQGRLFVSIDDEAETEVSLYDESINKLFKETVYTNNTLEYKIHTVTVRAEGKASVDAIIINREIAETVVTELEDAITDRENFKQVYAWRLSNHNALYTDSGASVSFSYYGYDFKIISYKARTQGKIFVTIDDREEIEIDLYDDSTDLKYKAIVLNGAGLDLREHKVVIRTEGKVILDAIHTDEKVI